MSEARNIHGLWWFPENPNERWVGVLTLAPNTSPTLVITIPKGHSQIPDPYPALLHGCDEHGRPISLFYVSQPHATGGAAVSRVTYSAGRAVLGVALPNPDAFLVNALNMTLQHFHEWSGVSGFIRNERPPLPEHHVHYRRPEDVAFVVDSDFTVKLCTSCRFSASQSREEVREITFLCLESKRGFSLARCQELLSAVRGLLHFATLERVYPSKLTAERGDHGVMLGDEFVPHEMELWSALMRGEVETRLMPDDWLFEFKDVRAEFGGFMARWLTYSETFGEALGCYYTTVYHPLPYEVDLLCLTQALEAYHGIKFQSHQARDFAQRIQELAVMYAVHFDGMLADADEFAEKIRDNRNYYTHHNPKWLQTGRVVSGAALQRLNETLMLLFQMCVLADMGISAERFRRLRRKVATRIIEYT